jgi:hypothetical protein
VILGLADSGARQCSPTLNMYALTWKTSRSFVREQLELGAAAALPDDIDG